MEQFFSSIPTGCEFDPTDEELVGDFLFKKINNIWEEFSHKRKMMNSEAEQDPIKRLKVTHETDWGSPQEFNSDSKSINPEKHESTSESVIAAEQNNGFLDLAVCGLITSQQPMLMHDQFTSQPVQTYADADDDFLMICNGSDGPSFTIDELFSNDQSFEQSDPSPDLQALSDYLICEGWQNDMVAELFSNDPSFKQSDPSPDLQALSDYLIGWQNDMVY